MYRVRSGVALALALAVIGSCAHAERLQPGSPLSGYQCYHIDAEALEVDAGGRVGRERLSSSVQRSVGGQWETGRGVGRGLCRLAVTEAKWVCSDPEVWRRRRMDLGVCDQAAISRAWIERRLHFVVAR